MKKVIALITLTVISYSNVFGQQTPNLEHYLVNPYFYNPAGVGNGGTNIYLDYHKQWADFSGAPETQFFTFDKSFKKDKFGVGVKLINDEVNILGSTGGYFSYSYKVKLGKVQSLRFGVEAGFKQTRVLFDKVVASDNDEALLFRSNQRTTTFDGSAGLIYRIQKFTLGFAAQNLIPSKFRYQNSETNNELVYSSIQHYFISAMYDFDLGESKWDLQPSVLVRGAKGLPLIFDGNLTTSYDDLAWLTLRYKYNVGYSVGAGGVIANQVKIGYAYGISSNELAGYNNGTHEVILGVSIAGGSGKSSGGLSSKQLAKIESQNNELLEKTDYLEKQNQTLKEELERQKEELRNKVFGLDELKKQLEKEMGEWKNNPSNISDSGMVNTINQSAAEELGKSDLKEIGDKYIIIGATRGFETAKEYQEIILREYKQNTKIIQNDRKSWYLIYTLKTDSIEEAQKELKRVKKIDVKNIYVGKPWVYEVE